MKIDDEKLRKKRGIFQIIQGGDFSDFSFREFSPRLFLPDFFFPTFFFPRVFREFSEYFLCENFKN